MKVVLAGIPPEAAGRGVYTEEAMRERFLKVERIARRLALIPEQGGSLPLYFLSFVQSFLLIKAVNPIPAAELADEPVEVAQLDTYDILQRARYWKYVAVFHMLVVVQGLNYDIINSWHGYSAQLITVVGSHNETYVLPFSAYRVILVL